MIALMIPVSVSYAVLAISLVWLACCAALMWVCISDLIRQWKEADKQTECHDRLRRISKETESKDGSDDEFKDANEHTAEYIQMLEEAPPHCVPTPPNRHAWYPNINPFAPSTHASHATTSVAPTEAGSRASRPIRAWSAAHD